MPHHGTAASCTTTATDGTDGTREKEREMDWKLELVAVPVSDVDRAKAFYTEKIGFNADHDHKVSDEIRFVQLTPPGSACSIAIGTEPQGEPGSARACRSWSPMCRRRAPSSSSVAWKSAKYRCSPGGRSCSSRPGRQRLGRPADPRRD